MLSTDSRKILKFLKKHRPNEYSKPEIIDSVHIEHADKIIEQLRIDDYLQLYMDTRDDKVVAVYTISDIGMAALEERRRSAHYPHALDRSHHHLHTCIAITIRDTTIAAILIALENQSGL